MLFFPFTRLDRYIMSQILLPFLFGMIGFLIIMSIDPLYFALNYVINEGVPFPVVARWFFFRLISDDMIYAFPMSMLLSALMSFGRLSKDSEITAMLAGGISFFRVIQPVLLLSVIITGGAFLYGEYVVPFTSDVKRELKHGKIDRVSPPKTKSHVFLRDSKDRFIYAGRADSLDARLDDVIVLEFESGTVLKSRTAATMAKYMKGSWVLFGAIQYNFKGPRGERQQRFDRLDINLKEPPSAFVQESTRAKEMSARALAEKIQLLHGRGVVDLKEYLVELYSKFSVPFACVIFAFIGVLMGHTSQRSGSFVGFGISILVIFIYYVMMSFAKTAGKEGTLSPMIAAWTQNLFFLAYGGWLLSRVKS